MPSLTLTCHEEVSALNGALWDSFVGSSPPVLHHDFLSALEAHGCVGAETGWLPRPLIVRDESSGTLVGSAPCYIKLHSMGEFVYDWAWADASHRSGLQYYPKLVIAAPFTPVSGPRLLTTGEREAEAQREIARHLLSGAEEVARLSGCTGVHMLFCTREEAQLAEELGFVIRSGVQFHWHNEGYRDFEDFLTRFRSKRRNQIRRERRRIVESGIETLSLTGDAITSEHMEHAFRFYRATVDRFTWGRPYLNRALFDALYASQRDAIQLTLARERDTGEILAGTFNFQKGDARYGRYWGCDSEVPMLHFEVCSYAAIDDCIAHGIQRFEAGAGGGPHKYGRGFLPVETYSAHKLFHEGFHQSVARFCAEERRSIRAEIASLKENLFVR